MSKENFSVSELLVKHIAQEATCNELEIKLKEAKALLTNTNSLIFKRVNQLQGKQIEVDGYLCKIETTQENKSKKTTYKYKDILKKVEETYELNASWLKKLYKKFSTTTPEQKVVTESLVIVKV